MDNVLYITGHKNPDTDSICSAIAYADLKKKLGISATPVRLGEISRETEFVLEYFSVEVPEFIFTVKTQISDLDIDIISPVSPDISIKTAWTIMKRNNVKTLPVVDENEKLLGVVTLSDITNKYMDAIDNNTIASSNTDLRNIVDTLSAKLITGSQEEFKTSGKIVVASMNSEDLDKYIETGDIVITGNRVDSQLKSIECGANCLIITGGSELNDNVIKLAQEMNSIIMVTPSDTFTTARLINQSVPIGYIMTQDNMVKFNIDDFIDDIRDKMMKTRYRSYPVVDDANRIKGFISRYHLISKRKKRIILLDHNEKTQTVNGLDQAEILEIIDHHRLGDIETSNPIFFKNEPVGSTATIIANIYIDMGIRPSKSMAGILCAAIISDTLKFNSPTCTYTDRMIADKLAEIAGISIEEFSNAMFKAGSSLKGKTPKDILNQDMKEYKIGNYKLGIGQIYSMNLESINDMREPLHEYLEQFAHKNNYNLVMLLVTDILNQGSEVIFAGDSKDLIEKAFNVQLKGYSIYLPGVMSRKKQIIPLISSVSI